MNAQDMMDNAVDSDSKAIYRLGGLSAFALVIGYLIIIGLYIPVYPFPSEGQAMLEYFEGKTVIWWAIIGVSAVTDVLYLAIAFSLYEALKGINRSVMLVGAGFKWLFAVLELAITWPNFVALIGLSARYAAATTDVQRMTYVAAANYAVEMTGSSSVLKFYTILVPALGTLLIGLVMRKGIFSKVTAYLGVITGVLGIVSVVGPLFVSALDPIIILTSLLSTVWFLLVGIKLYRLSQTKDLDNTKYPIRLQSSEVFSADISQGSM